MSKAMRADERGKKCFPPYFLSRPVPFKWCNSIKLAAEIRLITTADNMSLRMLVMVMQSINISSPTFITLIKESV